MESSVVKWGRRNYEGVHPPIASINTLFLPPPPLSLPSTMSTNPGKEEQSRRKAHEYLKHAAYMRQQSEVCRRALMGTLADVEDGSPDGDERVILVLEAKMDLVHASRECEIIEGKIHDRMQLHAPGIPIPLTKLETAITKLEHVVIHAKELLRRHQTTGSVAGEHHRILSPREVRARIHVIKHGTHPEYGKALAEDRLNPAQIREEDDRIAAFHEERLHRHM